MDDVEPAGADPPVDRLRREAEGEELLARHGPALTAGQRRDRVIWGELTSHIDV
jgi:hypothetical protein